MPDFQHPRPKLVSFFMCTCPRCGQEKVFRYPWYKIGKFTDTRDECGHCHLNYMPETGFFFGAMYWSYAMLVGLIVTLSVIFSLIGMLDKAVYWIPLIIICLLPFIFRYSRMLMLYVVYPVMFKGLFQGKSPGGTTGN